MKQLATRVTLILGVVTLLIANAPVSAQEPIELPPDAAMEMSEPPEGEAATMPSTQELLAAEKGTTDAYESDIAGVAAARVTFRVYKWQRGRTLYISPNVVSLYCGDLDGCSLRLGMYNWDNTGRVASRESLLYYNRVNRAWRASAGDRWGADANGRTEHVMNAWACYFTDGVYNGWRDQGDPNPGFGLLSWNQYNAECILTIID